MEQEKENQLKAKLLKQIVGSVSFAEIVKILHELATREVNVQFEQFTEEEKEELYNELFPLKIEQSVSEQDFESEIDEEVAES